MTVVTDASVLVAALIGSRRTGTWAEFVVADSALAVPEFVLVETTNILRRLERAGENSRLEATSAFRGLPRLDFSLFPFAPFSERIWELTRKNHQGGRKRLLLVA